ncbi:hypothetical protein FF011L_13000 [Roseimaritima multifibrata]|uniref:Uncharacterized protein n=1 Tax=Roseimaritima multifibrata TaxID=1930274 RepID=A0A517MCD0_9BACT|nr:hypothetical protein [Roseimaritima multifibrata]QDS92553.1 hypothetical protein FF011L_13000 [Roseimaritima multifibrata]
MSSAPLNSPDTSRWDQNHGNFLLGFLLILLLIGAALLAYQQSRPAPQRFVPRVEATAVSDEGDPAEEEESLMLTPAPSEQDATLEPASTAGGDSPEEEPQ